MLIGRRNTLRYCALRAKVIMACGNVCSVIPSKGGRAISVQKKGSFAIPNLIRIFHASLVALIPIAERARIAWHGQEVSDPWEDIERTLFSSIVGSVVENMVPSPPGSLPSYGLIHQTYADRSFITERPARLRGSCLVFVGLIT